MIKSSKSSMRFFLAKLSLPVHKFMVRTAVDCANNVAETLSFDAKEAMGIKLAVDEAFCNAVDHFSGVITDDERIHLEFHLEDDSLIISIREKGIPFDRTEAERFTPDDLEAASRPGLGSLLMHNAMDSVELFVHGREGKEVRLTKKIAHERVSPMVLEAMAHRQKRRRVTVKDPLIRLAEVDDLPEVSRLAWRCYGYTQEELLYDVEVMQQKTKEGGLKSMVAFDPESGNMIGHIGLKYHDPSVKVPEMGLAFVDSTYRSPRLPHKIAQELFDLAEAEGCSGIFDCSVTTHTFSQKDMHEMGSRPCGLLLGITASGMQAKELATSKQEKGSVVNHYSAFERSPKTIFIPAHHQKMVDTIYHWLEVPRTFGTPDEAAFSGEASVSIFPLPEELNVVFIVVNALGEQTVEEIAEGLQQCRKERRDAVYAFIPTSSAATPFLVEQCERMGFFFAGIMPHIHDGDDRIIMQYVDISIDMEAIRTYGDMTKELFNYIKREQQRAQSHK